MLRRRPQPLQDLAGKCRCCRVTARSRLENLRNGAGGRANSIPPMALERGGFKQVDRANTLCIHTDSPVEA